MPDNTIIEIIKLCLAIDLKAAKIYSEMAVLSGDQEIKSFWQSMSTEEHKHVQFWKKLSLLAEQGAVPQIFDDYEKVRAELYSVNSKVDTLFNELQKPIPEISKMFLLAYRMEFYLLHPAFEKLFFFASHADLVSSNPEDEYENHLKAFITALNRYGKSTPEMELLGETIQRLWLENRYLAKQSMTDPLTGVLNRRGFFSSILPLTNVAQRNRLSAGVLLIDIDNFKHINDSYGHQMGDNILKHVSSVLSKSKRSSDVIGRYGGEEFIVYLASIPSDSIFHVADKMRSSIEKSKNKWDIPVTVSIGAVSHIMDIDIERDISELIKEADVCLYASKKAGRNRVTVSQ